MNLAISNIAWDLAEDDAIRDLLTAYNISQIEIAPTKVWKYPFEATPAKISGYRNFWADRDIQIVSFQSLLFGQPQLTIFADPESRKATLEYLEKVMALAEKLGGKILVFGSPRNRRIDNLSHTEAWNIAIPFFHELGILASHHQLKFCIEPNPKKYGCDFIQTAAEALELVNEVSHPGFQVHLDAGAMIMNEEPFEKAIEDSFAQLAHFHISEPNLAIVGDYPFIHQRLARILTKLHYQHSVSIEMLNNTEQSNPEAVQAALEFVTKIYEY